MLSSLWPSANVSPLIFGVIPAFVCLLQHIVYGTQTLTIVYDHAKLADKLAHMCVCTYIYVCVYTHANLNGKPVLDTNITIHCRLSTTHILTQIFSYLLYNLSQLEGIVVVAVITSSPSTPN